MECDSINERLQVYLEGMLDREEEAAVEEHLRQCESCAASLEDLGVTIQLVKGLDEVEPPPWMTHRIMTRVRAEARPKRGILDRLFRPLSVKLPIEALAVVLLGVATYYVFKAVEPEVSLVKQPAGVPGKEAPSEIKPPPLKDQAPAGTGDFRERPRRAEDDKAAPASKKVPDAGAERDTATESREEAKVGAGVRGQEKLSSPAPAAPAIVPSEPEARLKASKLEQSPKAQAAAAISVYVPDPERAAGGWLSERKPSRPESWCM
jgi:hypothetical protein